MDFDNIIDSLKEGASYISCPQRWGYCSGVEDCAKAFLYEISRRGAITDKDLHKVFKKIKTFRDGL